MKIWQTTFLLNVIFMVNQVYSFPHLSSLSEMNATWKASNTIPCHYQPSDEYIQKEIRWSKDDRTVIQRDKSGDHIPMSKYRGKASILNGPAGDVSLILDMMLGDSGAYFCEVTWTSRATKETATNKVHTQVKVIKGITKTSDPLSEATTSQPAFTRTGITKTSDPLSEATTSQPAFTGRDLKNVSLP
ncbi:V-set and immunoglobulin domain-containing protein 4-like isoform X2 [Protopterus annectens]|uniref:V-set and immunoglobulin domain-containing protein 4-like isoform X2 n=1 Tax=Protopterus annectens TaxID=7888 RepID=UPI001CF9359A|nr:V-set and immunoglobulin domain-containing protein 4-like isoform X2 [Protopterus annectens]